MENRGQVLPVAALALAALCGAAALAVDVGTLHYQQRLQQTAADSAAMAGATELNYPASADVTAAAKHDASLNGFTDDNGATVSVTVNHPPTSGSYAGNAGAVEVIVAAKHPTFFEHVFGTSFAWVQARAVAGFANVPHGCVYMLGGGVTNMNASTINAPNCGVVSNGTIHMNAGTITAAEIGAVGGVTANAATFNEAQPSTIVPVTDPCPQIAGCAYLTAHPPSTSPCSFWNLSLNGSTNTLNPGVYCGGLTLNGANVTFNPGVYVITGGSLNVNGSTMTGSGVTFDLPNNSVNANAATFNLTAPASGNDAGILFYQPSTNSNVVNFNGSGGTGLAGALYFPAGHINANASFGSWLFIIAQDANMNAATATIPSNQTFPGLQHAALGE
ncbi:MAG: hypothetical protein JO103_02565 [Candidatus Eremiobacteraeota bacterium]|nr:hypothetical protein [Candidatus Eremiobacteraeota bacterium]MBV9408310.1 hypothetical protein [Candidatus Eremiobacteraeota bacterium]